MPAFRRLATLALLVIVAPVAAQNKKPDPNKLPRVLVASPIAIEVGKTTKLKIRGLRFEGVTAIQVQEPKSTGKILGKVNKVGVPNNTPVERVGDQEVEIELTLPAEVPGGSVPFALVNAEGAGPGFAVAVIDDTPRLAEKEGNNGFRQAQPIALPQVVEGKIDGGQDVDVFRFTGQAGQRLRIELQAARFGSQLDGIVTLFDEHGRILLTSTEAAPGDDPVLEVTLPQAGAYFISVMDALDQGSGLHAYRLIVRAR